jgi:glycosyltransferase involved in cell wall biosynthesis
MGSYTSKTIEGTQEMKILLCTNSFENIVNGPAKFANLILEINQLYPNHQVKILTEDSTQPHEHVYKVDLHLPPYLKPFSQFLRMFIYHKYTRKIHKTYPFDVLVYNNAFIGLWSAIVSGQPTVGMINDDNNLSTTILKATFNKLWFKQIIFKQFEKLSTRFHRAIISNSDYLTKGLIKAYNLHPQKIYRLYKAIDLSTIRHNPVRDFTFPIKILFVKADYIRGGLPVLAQALGLLKEMHFVVTIIGPHQHFAKNVYSLFDKFSHIQVKFMAEQPQKIVYEQLNINDIFCVPSLREALGVANIEALAFGISVISTHTGGIPEVLDHGNNGWLILPNDSQALAAAIKTSIENEFIRKEKSASARVFVERFTKTNMFKEFITILEHAGRSSSK